MNRPLRNWERSMLTHSSLWTTVTFLLYAAALLLLTAQQWLPWLCK